MCLVSGLEPNIPWPSLGCSREARARPWRGRRRPRCPTLPSRLRWVLLVKISFPPRTLHTTDVNTDLWTGAFATFGHIDRNLPPSLSPTQMSSERQDFVKLVRGKKSETMTTASIWIRRRATHAREFYIILHTSVGLQTLAYCNQMN